MSVVVLIAVTLAAIAVAGWRLAPRIRALFAARPSHRTDRIGSRIGAAAGEILTHRRLFQRPLSGAIHALVLVSFAVLLTAILQAYAKVLVPSFVVPAAVATAQDVFAVVMLIAVGLALFQRLVLRPRRFAGSNGTDGLAILGLIVAIVVTMELEFILDALAGNGTPGRPIAGLVAGLFPGATLPAAAPAAAYWAHIAAILVMLVYIPGSKHLHMFAAFPDLVLRNRGPRGRLAEPVAGANRVTDFARKDMLDLHACTECGRCQDACPAYAEGLPLSPKRLIMDMRDGLSDTPDRPLAGGIIGPETLWACTSCAACMEVCPIQIEHVPKIVDMRRSLVEAGDLADGLEGVLRSFQKNGNSFGKPARQRPKWAKELDFEIPDARREPVDYLWFVGDYASYHPLVASRTREMARLLHRAGVSFGILHEAEKNSGNDVRRVGEEGLFAALAADNIAELSACTFKAILTTDPHTLNTLGNEYAALGFDRPVVHHTQLLHELVEAGRLPRRPSGGIVATYHDPCYLGRYNGRFDAPRAVIDSQGYRLHDMGRCRENSFCCGAGGGRIFMNVRGPEERPSESRIREALAIPGVSVFVVACPKDLVMYTAAVETLGVGDRIRVAEITELFAG